MSKTPTYTYSGSLGTTITPIHNTHINTLDTYTMESPVWVDGKDLYERLKSIEDRLAIVGSVDENLLKKYPTLKQAYDNYKLVEALVMSKEGNSGLE